MNFSLSRFFVYSLFFFTAPFCLLSAAPALVFSANDQSSGYHNGAMYVLPGAKPGSVSALDFSTFPPKVEHLENLPCTVIGPPTCVAATAAGSHILLAGAMCVDPKNPKKLTSDHRVTLLRWTPTGLVVVDQAEIGGQPTGISLAKGGERAYVTLREEGSVAVLNLKNGKISVDQVIPLSKSGDDLCHLALSPDEKTAFATFHKNPTLFIMDVKSDGGLEVTQKLAVGQGAYVAKFFPDGNHAVIACTQDGALDLLSRQGGGWKISQKVTVGHVPEGLDISPDGKWVATAVFGGINSKGKSDPFYGIPPYVDLFAVHKGDELVHQQILILNAMAQCAAFTPDSDYLVVGQYRPGKLNIYALKDGVWKDTGRHVSVPGHPAALFTAKNASL